MDKIVKSKTACDECGKEFDGEFIQHDTPADDWPWEKEKQVREVADEDGHTYLEMEDAEDLHEQPTLKCHFCPDCIQKLREYQQKRGK